MQLNNLSLLVSATAGSIIVSGYVGYLIGLKKRRKHYVAEEVLNCHENVSLDDIDRYIKTYSLREPEILQNLRKYKLNEQPKCLADPAKSQFFRLLINMIEARKCLEVQMYSGYNTLSCALSLPSNGLVYAIETNESYINIAKEFFKKANIEERLNICIGDSMEVMEKLIIDGHSKTFDFININADIALYETYLEKALILLRVGGIITLNNTLSSELFISRKDGNQLNDRFNDIDKFHKKLRKDDRFLLSLIKIANGVAVCRKI